MNVRCKNIFLWKIQIKVSFWIVVWISSGPLGRIESKKCKIKTRRNPYYSSWGRRKNGDPLQYFSTGRTTSSKTTRVSVVPFNCGVKYYVKRKKKTDSKTRRRFCTRRIYFRSRKSAKKTKIPTNRLKIITRETVASDGLIWNSFLSRAGPCTVNQIILGMNRIIFII